ncbi:hypothetical protein Bca101_047502 [Brassica carinata]
MGIDMVLVDEKATLIQASIRVHRLGTDTCFHPIQRQNQITEIAATLNPFPGEIFRFRSYGQLLSLAFTNTELLDVVGEVRRLRRGSKHGEETLQQGWRRWG